MFETLERRSLLSATVPVDPLAVYPDLVNRQVTSDANVQQMPSIAVDPLDAKHLVLAFMDYSLVQTGYAGIGVAASHDAGDSWNYSSVPLPSGFEQGAADPIVRFDDQGHVFVSFMAVTYLGEHAPLSNPNYEDRALGIQSNNGIFVARSDDGGLTWNAPTTVVSNSYLDHDVIFDIIPDLAIDTYTNSPYHGNMYATWTRIYPRGQFPSHPEYQGGTDVMIAVSSDGGQSWETQVQQDQSGDSISVVQDPINADGGLPGVGAVTQSQLAIGADGKIYLSEFGGGDFAINVSSDGGKSFLPPNHTTGQQLAFGTGNLAWVSEDGLPTNQFRTWSVRAIAADPTHPQQVYAVDVMPVTDKLGERIDAADAFFAGSSNSADTWQPSKVLNDDNGGQSATGSSTEDVISGQAMPRLAVDGQGNIGVIWYDTRRDPADHLLDVYGTVSTDGGQTFSPNFRITDVSFDADNGKFTDGAGKDDYYLGDYLGFAMADGTAYAAWTDTRMGNQDIYFAKYPIRPAVPPWNDRYEANDTPAAATDLGQVIQRTVPKLAIAAGDEDWFRVEAAATGDLVATAMLDGQTASSAGLRIELWDNTGSTLLASGEDVLNDAQIVIGQEARLPGHSGQSYLVRVLGANNAENVPYSLHLQSLTADLGTCVFKQVDGSIESGSAALYRVTAAAAGSLNVQVTGGDNAQGEFKFQILDPKTLAVLASSPSDPSLAASSLEPNDSIGQANDTGLAELGSVTIHGLIGDGDFGGISGDYDFYRFHAAANEIITVNLDPKVFSSSLDGVLVLYNSTGNALLDSPEDSGSNGDPESFSYRTQSTGDYYLAVYGYGSDLPTDPSTPGTGNGVGSTGQYQLTITAKPVGPGASKNTTLSIQEGQSLLLLVSGEGTSSGDFSLQLTNLDQFSVSNNASLFVPDGLGASSVAMADLNRDGKKDLVVANTLSNTISVFLGNGDGTFQSPRQFEIGAFATSLRGLLLQGLPSYGRAVSVADLNGDGIPDVVVTNCTSADVSVLLGRGDGTFVSQRRFDAATSPIALAVGDLNGDQKPDLVVIDSPQGSEVTVAALIGRGNGTFMPQQSLLLPSNGAYPPGDVVIADFNNDGIADLAVSGRNKPGVVILLGNGDGTFRDGGNIDNNNMSQSLAVGDVNGDGKPDIINTWDDQNGCSVFLGNGDGTFQNAMSSIFTGQNPVVVAVVDFGSQVTLPGGSIALGAPDGNLDLVVADCGVARSNSVVGVPEIVLLPNLGFDAQGRFLGFGRPIQLAKAKSPQALAVGDLNGDGLPDIAVVDRDGILTLFGKPPTIAPNNTPQTARDLGAVVHLAEPTLTIVPGHEDAWYRLTVPTESVSGAGDEIIDFSALFQYTEGAGLSMEVSIRNADGTAGNLLGSGERLRIQARQGEELLLHVFGVTGGGSALGAGAYTLVIDVLPQVAAIDAEALLPGGNGRPGGPTTSIVITLQGDRLDPAAAEDTANYTVTYLGQDGLPGTADDRVISLSSIVYNPGANVEASSGQNFPTAVRQTVTLLVDDPLPAGSYMIQLSPRIQAAAFTEGELDLLADKSSFNGHPAVSDIGGQITEGIRLKAVDLVLEAGALGNLDVFEEGTQFLTQLQNDLGATLDAILTRLGDDPSVITSISRDILERLGKSLGEPGHRPTSILAIFLDPVSYGLASLADGGRTVYNLQTDTLSNNLSKTFVEVGGNVELIVVADAAGTYQLNIADVPKLARGTAVLLGANGDKVDTQLTTEAIRQGQRSFTLSMDSNPPPVNPPPVNPSPVNPTPVNPTPNNPQPGNPPSNSFSAAKAAFLIASLAHAATTLEVSATPSQESIPSPEGGYSSPMDTASGGTDSARLDSSLSADVSYICGVTTENKSEPGDNAQPGDKTQPDNNMEQPDGNSEDAPKETGDIILLLIKSLFDALRKALSL
jgi:hypothetical protein